MQRWSRRRRGVATPRACCASCLRGGLPRTWRATRVSEEETTSGEEGRCGASGGLGCLQRAVRAYHRPFGPCPHPPAGTIGRVEAAPGSGSFLLDLKGEWVGGPWSGQEGPCRRPLLLRSQAQALEPCWQCAVDPAPSLCWDPSSTPRPCRHPVRWRAGGAARHRRPGAPQAERRRDGECAGWPGLGGRAWAAGCRARARC